MKSRLHSLVNSGRFNRLMVAVILLAGVLAGLETSATLRESCGALLWSLDTLVLAIFVAEIALKIAAHGRRPWGYFQDGWNVFDFLIVAVCCLPLEAQFAAVFRLGRGLRLLRLVTAVPRLQLLVGALLKSLGAMGYVTLLLALVFYIYGVAGVHLGHAVHDDANEQVQDDHRAEHDEGDEVDDDFDRGHIRRLHEINVSPVVEGDDAKQREQRSRQRAEMRGIVPAEQMNAGHGINVK